MFNNMLAYNTKKGIMGIVTNVNMTNKTIDAEVDGKGYVFNWEDITIYEEAFILNGESVYDNDVIKEKETGFLHLVSRESSGEVYLNRLDNNLETMYRGYVPLSNSDIKSMDVNYEVYAHYRVAHLKSPELVDFDIRVVKGHYKGEKKYYYACNIPKEREVDLIEVFAEGPVIVAPYKRMTLTHSQFTNKLDIEMLKEVSAKELSEHLEKKKRKDKTIKYVDGNEADNPNEFRYDIVHEDDAHPLINFMSWFSGNPPEENQPSELPDKPVKIIPMRDKEKRQDDGIRRVGTIEKRTSEDEEQQLCRFCNMDREVCYCNTWE